MRRATGAGRTPTRLENAALEACEHEYRQCLEEANEAFNKLNNCARRAATVRASRTPSRFRPEIYLVAGNHGSHGDDREVNNSLSCCALNGTLIQPVRPSNSL